MAEVAWAARALADLTAIHEYVARDSPAMAGVLAERIVRATERLASFALSGPILPELPDGPFRQIRVGAYRVVYRVEADRVWIVMVVHGNRDLPPLLPTDA